jgi:hypothetical protein
METPEKVNQYPMTPDEVNISNLRFMLKRVSDMRAAQKMFFATRGKPDSREWLIESKNLEKEVDNYLKQLEDGEENTKGV